MYLKAALLGVARIGCFNIGVLGQVLDVRRPDRVWQYLKRADAVDAASFVMPAQISGHFLLEPFAVLLYHTFLRRRVLHGACASPAPRRRAECALATHGTVLLHAFSTRVDLSTVDRERHRGPSLFSPNHVVDIANITNASYILVFGKGRRSVGKLHVKRTQDAGRVRIAHNGRSHGCRPSSAETTMRVRDELGHCAQEARLRGAGRGAK